MRGRLENLLGALAESVGSEVDAAVTGVVSMGGSAPSALSVLLRRPGSSIEVLRGHLGLSHSATVRLVDRLEGDGLAVRADGPDGRQVAVELTDDGRHRALRLHEERRRVLARSVAGLSASDRRDLEILLDRLLRTRSVLAEDPRPICRLCEVPVCPLRRCPVPAAR